MISGKHQPLHVKLTSSKAEEPPLQQEKSDTLTESLPPETSEDPAIEQEVMKSVPKVYKTGARQLLDEIKDNRDVLHWNNKGELLYEEKAISGSHLVDLVNDILRHRKGFEPVGWSVFARGLARMNVPENLVRNPQRQSAVREFKTRLKNKTPTSPYSRWLLTPTPPSTSAPVKRKGE